MRSRSEEEDTSPGAGPQTQNARLGSVGFSVALAIAMVCFAWLRFMSGEDKMKAIANGVVADVAGPRSHFVDTWESICREMHTAETPVVPPLQKTCSRGCQCQSAAKPGTDPRTVYDCGLWQEPQWLLLKFLGNRRLEDGIASKVYVHHQARWRLTSDGCRLDYTVYGDLDKDGVYSTYVSSVETGPDGQIVEFQQPDVSVLWE